MTDISIPGRALTTLTPLDEQARHLADDFVARVFALALTMAIGAPFAPVRTLIGALFLFLATEGSQYLLWHTLRRGVRATRPCRECLCRGHGFSRYPKVFWDTGEPAG